MVSNSLWPKSGVCARAGRDEAQEASKDQIRRGLMATELRLYPRVSGKPREKLRQGSGRLRLASLESPFLCQCGRKTAGAETGGRETSEDSCGGVQARNHQDLH